MPICKKCNNHFSFRVIVDGKNKILANRKYCLECSPFGQHNTRKIHNTNIDKQKCICGICKNEFVYIRSKGHRSDVCNSCIVTRHRQRLKEKLVSYKGGKCECCGYDKCIGALHFHHKNPKEKDFTIGGKSISLEKLKTEVDKCVLVCSNCHSEIHEEIRDKGFSEKINKITR